MGHATFHDFVAIKNATTNLNQMSFKLEGWILMSLQ
jgi:hypothetical protein